MNGSRRPLVLVCALACAFSASRVLGLPPTSNEANWKGPKNNCYNYATDTKSNDFKQPGGLPWPNVRKGNLTAAQWCTKVKARAVGDGLVNIAWVVGAPIPNPPAGYNLVALGGLAGVKGGGGDYHWWRRNGDGTWSHKRGETPAKSTYTDGGGDGVGDNPATPAVDESANDMEVAITDPRVAAQRDGYDLCGFMGVPKAPAVEEPNPSEPAGDEVRIGTITTSGGPSSGRYLRGGDISALEPSLPTLAPSNEVPDPLWTGMAAGDSAGFGVWPGSAVPLFPSYLRVFRGVVAVYDDLDGTTITYYNDDNGLETALLNLTLFTGASCHAASADCAEITEPEARGFGWQYQGDGALCSQVDCSAGSIPTVSNVGLVALLLLTAAAGVIVIRRSRRGDAAA